MYYIPNKVCNSDFNNFIAEHTQAVIRNHYRQQEEEVFAVLLFVAVGCNMPIWKVLALSFPLEREKNDAVSPPPNRKTPSLWNRWLRL